VFGVGIKNTGGRGEDAVAEQGAANLQRGEQMWIFAGIHFSLLQAMIRENKIAGKNQFAA
jgi:hypothetical protein